MLHGSETWPVRKENEVALQRAEMRMARWMCNVNIKDRVPSKELRERLGIDDIILILQQNRLQWYGHVMRKENTDWVKKCMEYEVEGSRPRGRPGTGSPGWSWTKGRKTVGVVVVVYLTTYLQPRNTYGGFSSTGVEDMM